MSINSLTTPAIVTSPADAVLDMYRVVYADGNLQVAEKLQDVYQRLNSGGNDVYVALCGLFSAGKSSLINAITSEAKLATGAIPTTAEVTAVRWETEFGNVVLLDTPGVDSTDSSHQEATEAALHKADVVVFVMDYQHVEGEENMELARMFMEQGKTLFLVINQIDKHLDWELSFESFQARIEQSFTDYGIDYEDVYYTTTKSHPNNELGDLIERLSTLADSGTEFVLNSVQKTVEGLADEFVGQRFQNQVQDAEERIYDSIGFLPFDVAEAEEWIDLRKQELNGLKSAHTDEGEARTGALQGCLEEARRLVELAQIAPYETTEKGRLYVESLRPGFKIGWIHSKQKTEEEQQRRLQDFSNDLVSRTEKYLVWPLHGKLREWLAAATWSQPDWRRDIEGIGFDVTVALLTGTVHHGALVSEQYPYQYVKDVVAKVKSGVVAAVIAVIEKWSLEMNSALAEESKENTDRIATLERELSHLSAWYSVFQERRTALANLVRPIQSSFEAVRRPN